MEESEPERIGHHKHRTHTHGRGTNHRTQGQTKGQIQQTCCQRNAQRIVEESPEQVLADVSNGSFAQFNGTADGSQRAVHQYDIRRFHGDVGTGTNGHTHVGSYQGGSIVDAVAYHEYLVSLLLQLLHGFCLMGGQNIRNHMGNSRLGGNGFGGGFVVTGEHYHIQAELLHGSHRCHGIGFQHIRCGNGAKILTILTGEVQRGLSFSRKGLQIGNGHTQLLHEPVIAAKVPDTPNSARHTAAGKGFKVNGFRIGIGAHFLQDGFGKGMFRLAFQCGGNPHEMGNIGAAGKDIRNLRLAGGKGSGLVQNHSIDMMEIFQGLRIFEQHAHLGAPAGTHHNGHGSRQTQSTGTGNHQHGNGAVQAEFQSIAAGHPDGKGNRRNGHNDGNKHTGYFVRKPGNGSFGSAGFLHHADHLGKGGILTDFVCPELEITFCIDGGCRHSVSGKFLHGNTFTGKGALVHRAPAFHHGTVHGNAAAGTDDDHVAYTNIFHGDFRFHAVFQNHGCFGT